MQSGTASTLSTAFAVLDLQGGRSGDAFATRFDGFDQRFIPGTDARGAASPAFDTSARYLYLYQDVNGTHSTTDVAEVRTRLLPSTAAAITSWGRFAGLGFGDEDGPVDATNVFGGRVAGADPRAAHRGVEKPAILEVAGGRDPGVDASAVVLTSESLTRRYAAPGDLKRGQRATLIGFTSNIAPVFADDVVRPLPPPPRDPADPGDIVDGSPEARGILRLVNLAATLYLRETVGLSPEGAERVGKHERFTHLDQLLVLVTTEDFRILLNFARDNGYVRP